MPRLSQAWMKPQFRSVDELYARISRCENAFMEPAHRANGSVVPNRFLIVGTDTDEVHGVSSEQYVIVQDIDVLLPLAMAIEESGVSVCGSIFQHHGQMRASLCVGEPTTVLGENYYPCIEVLNSYNLKLAVNNLFGLVRQICSNGMFGIDGICSSIYHKHLFGVEDEVAKWLDYLDSSALLLDGLPDLVERAKSIHLLGGDFESVLRAVGIGKQATTNILDDCEKYNPQILTEGVTVRSCYNAGTNYFSHRERGSFTVNRESIAQLSDMLTKDIDSLIAEGDKILKREQSLANP